MCRNIYDCAPAIALITVSLLTVCLYHIGLTGPFLLDDFANLQALNAHGGVTNWPAFLSFVFGNESGYLGRPVSMISFLLNDQYFPGSPEDYKFTNIFIHCSCGLSLFLFLQRFLKDVKLDRKEAEWIAFFVSSWWLLAPVNVSTTLYVVQRMTQLATLFTFLGLFTFLIAYKKGVKVDSRYYVLSVIPLYLFGALALFSKENGILIFAFAGICVATISRVNGYGTPRWFIATIGLPIVILMIWLVMRSEVILDSYELKRFDLIERLYTEARILWKYIAISIFPGDEGMGLIQDDIEISDSLMTPLSTLFSVLGHIGLWVAAWLLRKKNPLITFCILWFYIGHSLESTLIPLELYFEHRNYTPIIALLLIVVLLIWNLRLGKVYSLSIISIWIGIAAVHMHDRAGIWGDKQKMLSIWIQEHPNSVRAHVALIDDMKQSSNYNGVNFILNRMKEKWPDLLYVDIMKFKMKCGKVIAGPAVLNTENSKKKFYDSYGLTSGSIDILVNTVGVEECVKNNYIPIKIALENLSNNERLSKSIRSKAAFESSKLSALMKDFQGAIISIENAIKTQRRSMFFFAKAELLEQAGIYDHALIEIEKAIAIENQKLIHKRHDLVLYMNKKFKIIKRLEGLNEK